MKYAFIVGIVAIGIFAFLTIYLAVNILIPIIGAAIWHW